MKKWDLPKGWLACSVQDCTIKISTSGKKVKGEDYLSTGKYPIIDQGQKFISGYSNDNDSIISVKEQDAIILFGDHTKEIKFIETDFVPGADGTQLLRAKSNLLPKYFYYAARQIKLPELGYSRHYKYFKEGIIPVPSLETQQKIVAILDKAEEIKRLRTEANAQTHELIQSVFLDMFGDPEANPNRWSLNKISKLVIMDKDVVKSTDMSGITNYVGLVNIVSNTGELIKDNTQSDEIIKSNKFKFTKNHILYGKLRPYLNKVALPDYDGICSTDILTFRPLDGVATREYIGWLFRTPYFVNFATNKSQGANLPRISPSQIMNFECPHPPYELQIQFSNFVKTVETRNKFLNLANNEIDSIYRYLISETFKGELVA